MADIQIGLPPPGNEGLFSMPTMQGLNKNEFQQQAQNLAETLKANGIPYSTDEIVDFLSFIRESGISVDKKTASSLEAHNPFPSAPKGALADHVGGVFVKGGGGPPPAGDPNPWLDANPQTAFVVSFMELMEVMKQLKKIESDLAVTMLNLTWELGQDIATDIEKAAKIEAQMYKTAAIAALVKGAIAVGAMAFTVGMGAAGPAAGALKGKMAGAGPTATAAPAAAPAAGPGPSGAPAAASGAPASASGGASAAAAADAPGGAPAAATGGAAAKGAGALGTLQRVGGSIHNMSSWMQAINGLGSFADAAENFVKADLTIKKGQVDADKAILETYKETVRKAMDSAYEGWKSSQSEIDEIVRTLKDLLTKLYQAHNMQIH